MTAVAPVTGSEGGCGRVRRLSVQSFLDSSAITELSDCLTISKLFNLPGRRITSPHPSSLGSWET